MKTGNRVIAAADFAAGDELTNIFGWANIQSVGRGAW